MSRSGNAGPRDRYERYDLGGRVELRGEDLNLRPSGYEPDELPDCSTPRHDDSPSDTIVLAGERRPVNFDELQSRVS